MTLLCKIINDLKTADKTNFRPLGKWDDHSNTPPKELEVRKMSFRFMAPQTLFVFLCIHLGVHNCETQTIILYQLYIQMYLAAK